MMGQLRLLDNESLDNILNVKYYFNGDMFEEVHTKLINDPNSSMSLKTVTSMNGNFIQDNLNCKCFPSFLNEPNAIENIGLVYFFTLGWDKNDIQKVILYINQLVNLKILITDLNLKSLNNNYDLKLNDSIKTIHKIKNCKLYKATDTRVFYIYEMSNVIHNMNPKNMEVVFQPIDRNDILKSIKRLELYMNIQKITELEVNQIF